jgi:hypothetical protein
MEDFKICSIRKLLKLVRRVREAMSHGARLWRAAAEELRHSRIDVLDFKFMIHVIGSLLSRAVITRRQLALVNDDRLRYFRS